MSESFGEQSPFPDFGGEAAPEKLTPEMLRDPSELIGEEIDERGGNAVLLIGENSHHGSGTLEYEIKMLDDLAAGSRTPAAIYLEEDIAQQPLVEQYYDTGEMSEELEHYLRKEFVRGDTEGHDYKVRLLRKARDLKIPAYFIDDLENHDRDWDWLEKMQDKIGFEVRGVHVFIGGRTHAARSATAVVAPGKVSLGTLLDQHYQGKTVAVQVTTDGVLVNDEEAVGDRHFLDDLRALGRSGTTEALRISESPYESLPVHTGNEHFTMRGFDIQVIVPGEDLHKMAPSGDPFKDLKDS